MVKTSSLKHNRHGVLMVSLIGQEPSWTSLKQRTLLKANVQEEVGLRSHTIPQLLNSDPLKSSPCQTAHQQPMSLEHQGDWEGTLFMIQVMLLLKYESISCSHYCRSGHHPIQPKVNDGAAHLKNGVLTNH